MRFWRALLFGISALLHGVGSTNAETVVIRSGEHSDFTRLVLEFTDAFPVWRAGKTSEGYAIHIEQNDFVADVTQVFQRISRTRLEGLSFTEEPSQINLTVTCDCHIKAFRHTGQKLVVDIVSGPADADNPFEVAFEPQGSTENSSEIRTSQGPARLDLATTEAPDFTLAIPTFETERIAPTSQEPSGPGVVLRLPVTTNLPVQNPNLPPLEISSPALPRSRESTALNQTDTPVGDILLNFPDPATPERAKETQEILLRQIERAAGQGLLDANLPDIPDRESSPQEITERFAPPPPTEASPTANTTGAGLASHFSVEAETSVDRGVLLALPGAATIDDILTCDLGEQLDIRHWGNPDDIYAGIPEKRGNLLNGADQINQDAVADLVRAYLFAGFGAEARQMMTLWPLETDVASALLELTYLADGEIGPPGGAVSSLRNCPNSGAMWALLAEKQIPAQDVDHNAVLTQVSGLPPHLRNRFGARLIRLYSDAGDIERAAQIESAVTRVEGDHGVEFRIAQAETAAQTGLASDAENILTEIISEDSIGAIEALKIYLHNTLNKGDVPEPGILENAEALAFVHADTSTGTELDYLIVRSYTADQRLDDAIDGLKSLQGAINPYDFEYALAEISEQLQNLEEDSAFLELVYRHRSLLQDETIPENSRLLISARLVDLGFSEFGEGLLGTSLPRNDDEVLVLARAAFASGSFDRVIELTQNSESAEAIEIYLQSLIRSGKFESAKTEAQARGRNELFLQILWQSGDWDEMANTIDGSIEANAAQIMNMPPQDGSLPINPTSNPSLDLEASRRILENSSGDRTRVEEILEVFPGPTSLAGSS